MNKLAIIPIFFLSMCGTAPNGGWRFGDHVGTTNLQAFFNNQSFNREHTHGKRPTSGVLYPRPRKFNLPRKEEQG